MKLSRSGKKKTDRGRSVLPEISDISSSESSNIKQDEISEDLEEFERSLRHKHARACKAMSNGVYSLALEEFESILADVLSRYGEKHDRTGAALHNVAISNLRAGQLEDAMDAIEEAVKIRSRSLGRSHPKVADSLVELGIILLSMEEHDDALEVFERALKLRREQKDEAFMQGDADECNLKIAKVLNNIGCVNYEKGAYEAAKRSFQDAIDLQMSVFHSWFNLMCGADTTSSPGILTMASTMCNKGYVEIEQENYKDACKTFMESLEIQRKILGLSNKLVQSSLENLGYAHLMLNQKERALKAYYEIWDAQQSTNEDAHDKCSTLKKLIYVHCIMEQWQKALELLQTLDDLQLNTLTNDSDELDKTRKLIGEVNYQTLKLPSIAEISQKTFGCACLGTLEEEVHLDDWIIQKPMNTSKMSGHRVTHA